MRNYYLRHQDAWQIPVARFDAARNALVPPCLKGVEIDVGLGYRLPYGSMKIFAIRGLLEHLKHKGRLGKAKKLVMGTSGAAGLALAHFALDEMFAPPAAKVVLIMKRSVPLVKRELPLYTGRVEIVEPQKLPAIEMARRMEEDDRESVVNVDQYQYVEGAKLYETMAGPGMLGQIPGKVDLLINPIGTGGTAIGLGRAFRKANKRIHVVGGMCAPGHSISGMRSREDMKLIHLPWDTAADEYMEVDALTACFGALYVHQTVGILIGFTGGACFILALKKLMQWHHDGTLAALRSSRGSAVRALFPSHDGWRSYVGTPLPIPKEYYSGENPRQVPPPWELPGWKF